MTRNSQENTEVLSPAKQEYQRVMEENLNGDLLSNKIISYKAKAPQAPEGISCYKPFTIDKPVIVCLINDWHLI